jgi:cytidyltransferase-like protein
LKNKKNIGIVAGNFDVIHPGYIFLFNECKENCDHLIPFIHEDPSIEMVRITRSYWNTIKYFQWFSNTKIQSTIRTLRNLKEVIYA